MASGDDALALLKSIDASLKELVSISRSRRQKTVDVATDRQLDGQYGNPTIRNEPRDWTGAPMKTRRFSECPAQYLDLLAEMYDYFATKDAAEDRRDTKGRPTAPYKQRDAALARGWAKRVRENHPSVVEAKTAQAATQDGDWNSGNPWGTEVEDEKDLGGW